MRGINRKQLRYRCVRQIPHKKLLKPRGGDGIRGKALRTLCVRDSAERQHREERTNAHDPNQRKRHGSKSTTQRRSDYRLRTMSTPTPTAETSTCCSTKHACATTRPLGAVIADSLHVTLHYGGEILKSIPAERFCEVPINDINHPAFCVGHLAIYANKVFELIGRADLKVAMPFGDEHFKNGAPCVAQDGRYPSKEVLVGTWTKAWTAVANALPEVDDKTLAGENPMEGRMRERFPTVGSVVNFLCAPHNMMHLGQVSSWRRVAGLGSAM
ncbi:MAG: hypothetical protein EXS10_05290 [Phycisphaerales bacterium]|nr:hypothetical protein [Phycisphaerales bacterium]